MFGFCKARLALTMQDTSYVGRSVGGRLIVYGATFTMKSLPPFCLTTQ